MAEALLCKNIVIKSNKVKTGCKNNKNIPWPLVRKQTIPSDRHLLAKFSANFCG
jgi:hypothetical protein